MIFSEARMLWGLCVIPLLLLIQWHGVRRAAASLRRLVGDRSDTVLLSQRRPGQRRLGAALTLGAVALLLLGAAGPEWGREVVRRGASGSDVVLVLDLSASMDARDVPPSRIEEARREALAVVERMEGSRVGVVAFAGDAVRLCPLTLDRGSVRLALGALSSATVSEPGTDLGKALRRAARLMPAGRREEQAVVLWTDGEDLEAGARSAIEDIAASRIRVFAVGVGTAAGDVVPILDEQGRALDVKRDASGGAVRSRLDETLMRGLARRTHGAYFAASRPGGELPRLLGALESMARSSRGLRLAERPVARFPLLALLAAGLLLADRVRPRRRLTWRRPGDRAPAHSENGAAAAVVIGCLLVALPARAQTDWARGDLAFRAGHWKEADSMYASRLKRGGPSSLRVNRATTRARAGGIDEAERELRQLSTDNDRAGRAAGYNLGTLFGEGRRWDDALNELRRSLERDPGDAEARWNYEIILKRRHAKRERELPKPEPQSGTGAGAPQPAANPPGAASLPQAPRPAPSALQSAVAAAAAGQGMSRAQAEQLLDALAAQARIDLERQHRVRVMSDKRGKDW